MNILSDGSPISPLENDQRPTDFTIYSQKQRELLAMMRVKNDTMTTKKLKKLNKKSIPMPGDEIGNSTGRPIDSLRRVQQLSFYSRSPRLS